MRTIPCCRVAGLAWLMAASLLPCLCSAQIVLPSPDQRSPRPLPDPPGLQVVRTPDGSLIKRLPGDGGLPAASAARIASASTSGPAGLKLVQNGNVLMPAGREEAAAAVSGRALPLSVRQVGDARVLELPGLPTIGSEPASAAQPLPRGVRVVDLPAGAPLPLSPEPNTLYRRLRD